MKAKKEAPFYVERKVPDYFIKLAEDHLGTAIRDNSRAEKVEIGKAIDNGTWEDEE